MYTNNFVALSFEHGISEKALAVARALRSEGGNITAAHIHDPPQQTKHVLNGARCRAEIASARGTEVG